MGVNKGEGGKLTNWGRVNGGMGVVGMVNWGVQGIKLEGGAVNWEGGGVWFRKQ